MTKTGGELDPAEVEFAPRQLSAAHLYRAVVVIEASSDGNTGVAVQSVVGQDLLDVVPVPSSFDFILISPRFKDILVVAGATGWTAGEVHVPRSVSTRFPALERYAVLAVTGEAGPIRMVPGGNFPTPDTIWTEDGMAIDPLSWDGSDIFRASGQYTFVAARLAALLTEALLTNLDLRDLDELLRSWREVFPRKERKRRPLP